MTAETRGAQPGPVRPKAKDVLVVLLSHQLPSDLERTMETWRSVVSADSLLLAYGGASSNFSKIDFEQKVFISDPRLRLRDQQREHQSWEGVVQAANDFLQNSAHQYLYLVEYDHIPLRGDLLDRLKERLLTEQADVIAHHLHRIDGTSSAHYLYHKNEGRFHDYFARISKRDEKGVILSMLGTGSFWKRKAFKAVAACEEPFPIYVELYLPTLAHHLGFRLRDLTDQNRFVMHLGDRGSEIEEARRQGAWTLHPVKTLPASFVRPL
ncbi:MAG TPA: hypothetical protein VGG02_02985 [Chthoniobacterales bacterium]|jgi:hypothetical protein